MRNAKVALFSKTPPLLKLGDQRYGHMVSCMRHKWFCRSDPALGYI